MRKLFALAIFAVVATSEGMSGFVSSEKESKSVSETVSVTTNMNTRRQIDYDSMSFEKDVVKVKVRDFIDDRFTAWYPTEYPVVMELLDYHHDFKLGMSYPVYEVSFSDSTIEDAGEKGKVIAVPKFVDKKNGLVHVRKNTGQYEMNDEELLAHSFTEIVIKTEEGEVAIDEAKIREDDPTIPYRGVETLAKSLEIDTPLSIEEDEDRLYFVEKWLRPDETVYTRSVEYFSYPIPVYHYNKIVRVFGTKIRGGYWDKSPVRTEEITVFARGLILMQERDASAEPGSLPVAILLKSDWSFDRLVCVGEDRPWL